MQPEERKRQITEALDRQISEILRQHGDYATRWVLLCEVVEQDTGREMMWTLAPPQIRAWQSLGMLLYALQIEQAGTVRDIVAGGNDDG